MELSAIHEPAKVVRGRDVDGGNGNSKGDGEAVKG